MSSEARDKTAITDNWQIFSKKLFHHFIHHKKKLKVTKFQLKIICRSRVLDKNIHLWYIVKSIKSKITIGSIPLGFWQLKKEFCEGRMELSIVSLKTETVLTFLRLESTLFHSIIADGKKELLKQLCLS